MKNTHEILKLKSLAKRYARATRIEQYKALDFVSVEFGFKHWNALIAETKKGWKPSSEGLSAVEALVNQTTASSKANNDCLGALASYEKLLHGKVEGHAYEITASLGDVHMSGEGWHICIPEAPNIAPYVEIDERTIASNPMTVPRVLEEALQIARKQSARIHAKLATDWSRRSTKPDANGNVRHPFFRDENGASIEANTWFCLHCNGKITGPQIAQNLWHCPACGAPPIDIYEIPFWLDAKDEQPKPIKLDACNPSEIPTVKIVPMRPKLDLNSHKISLLIRSALLDDATNAGERLGALLADISVDEENDVWISFETDYWPEGKEPIQALSVAKLLGVQVFQDVELTSPPFAWAGIGEVTSSTLEYTERMLEAYETYSSNDKVVD